MAHHIPRIPLAYRLFFLYIEPVSALVGAYYAYFAPATYLSLTTFPSSSTSSPVPTPVDLATLTALRQLANLYLLFAFNEALVLRSTSNIAVWRTLLFGLLVADLGHLWSVSGFGWRVYTDFWAWNEMMWGNIGFVYLGAGTRAMFLAGIGV